MFKLEENWVVFFDLFSTNNNGDSIKPVAEELRKQRPDLKFFFCCHKNQKKNIELADEILINKSFKFKYVCMKAKYIISNMGFPNKRFKRNGQVFIQIWHGSPIKKLYLSKDKTDKRYKKHIKDVKQYKKTDVFCLQGEYFRKIFEEAFNLKSEQLAGTGLPRNDILFKDDKLFDQNFKKQLKLPDNKKIILYCPTWRRYDHKALLPFDLQYLKKELADEFVLLMRSHVGKHKWTNENNEPINIFDNEFCFNGGEYPDVTDLYRISDILISDYSSAVFDFALTRKPEILYIYDYQDYKKEFGLYFDYNNFAPFPTPRTQEELVNAIKNYPEISVQYEGFVNKYCEYETGCSTQNVISEMLKRGSQK